MNQRTLTMISGTGLLEDVTIMRPERVSDGRGGWPFTHVPSSTVRGSVQPITRWAQGEDQMADKQTATITHQAYLPGGTDVTADDQLQAKGKTFQVSAVMDTGGMGRFLTVELLEID